LEGPIILATSEFVPDINNPVSITLPRPIVLGENTKLSFILTTPEFVPDISNPVSISLPRPIVLGEIMKVTDMFSDLKEEGEDPLVG
jgi:hypothetical protein